MVDTLLLLLLSQLLTPAFLHAGSPGLGPISMRKEIVVFKDGFRSRQYCLSECAQTCKLMSDNEKQQQQQKGPQ